MHPVNEVLDLVGLRLGPAPPTARGPKEFHRKYDRELSQLKKDRGEFTVFKEFYYDAGVHPSTYMDFECEFAVRHLQKNHPASVLDIGSYRLFVIGMLAGYKVTTIDIRPRESTMTNETVVTSDAKELKIPAGSFDMVTSLCSLEHFGLGRYGDDFDMAGDKKAFGEMIRVLKPGGLLVFSTTITRSAPAIAFNAHRIYSYPMIRRFCQPMECVEEGFFSNTLGTACTLEQVVSEPREWDVYAGCWRKRA